jgi:tRNA threonylcarbamoyladenosine biosynthesis protein TsaE
MKAKPSISQRAGCLVSSSSFSLHRSSLVLSSWSAAETKALGRQLGRLLAGDEVIALSGPLGSGKTCFVQGLGRGLAVAQPINSPSYVLMKRYRGRSTLTHWDWYRLADVADLESCGFGDPQVEQGVVVIEWAERFLDQIEPPFLHIEIALTGEHSRALAWNVRGRAARVGRLVRDIAGWWTARHEHEKTGKNTGH